MVEGTRSLSGIDRAAVLLMSLGEQHAAKVLRHMGPKEVERLGSAMSSLANISNVQISQVLNEFMQAARQQTALGVDSDDYVRKVMVEALGDDKAGRMINRVLAGTGNKGMEALRWMDPVTVAEVIRNEHPQIIAAVLFHLDPDQAAAVLAELPEGSRTDLLMRVAGIRGVQPSAIDELERILAKHTSLAGGIRTPVTGGPKAVADILNYLDSATERVLSDAITERDEELGKQIRDLMFVFDNLKDVDDRGMQALLREVSSDTLVVALKGADESIREKIFKNMSKRAAEMLLDDLEAKGPVKLSDVQTAQKEILAVAQRMAESGDLALGGKGGEQYV
jgi:flagellar motor switch protein FliG